MSQIWKPQLTATPPEALTFSGARQTISFEVAGAFLPSVLLSVGVGGGGRVELGAGGAGDARAGAQGVAQACVYRGVESQTAGLACCTDTKSPALQGHTQPCKHPPLEWHVCLTMCNT